MNRRKELERWNGTRVRALRDRLHGYGDELREILPQIKSADLRVSGDAIRKSDELRHAMSATAREISYAMGWSRRS